MKSSEAGAMPLRPREGVEWREVRGRLVAVDMATGDYHVFNEVGGVIWRGLVAGRSQEAIVEEIVATYAVMHTKVVEDYVAFVAMLKECKLLGG
jgi:hypothetical protein